MQSRVRNEALWFPRHEPVTDEPRVWWPELFFCRLLAVLAREVASQSHPRAAHLGHFQRVELSVGIPGAQKPLIGQGVLVDAALSRRRRVSILKSVPSKGEAHVGKVERADKAGELV